ncbi:nipblb [Symbiodinium sp. CCMP2592]|nr:nipblb [Symbiodinium sp. CCMP2592]
MAVSLAVRAGAHPMTIEMTPKRDQQAESTNGQTESWWRRRAPERCDRSCAHLRRWLLRVLGIIAAEFWQHRRVFPLALAQMMLVADQPLLPTNMSAVAEEFGFDAAERDEKLGGVVSVVFFTFGALFSLLVGHLADRMRRTTLVCLCMLLGSSGTFANSQVQGFRALLCCRAAVGAATGGLIPASFALIGDMYSAEERPHAIGMVSIISGLGLSVGQALAGFEGTALGWRAPFALVGVLGWAVTALLSFTFEIRPCPCAGRFRQFRQSATASESEPSPQPSALLASTRDSSAAASGPGGPGPRPSSARTDLSKPTVLCICLQGITGCVPWAVIGTFMTDYLATNVHMGVPSATAVLFSFGVGCTTGTITGGKLGQYLYKKDKRLQGWLMGVTVWGGMLPMFCLFALGEAHPVIFHLLALSGGFLSSIPPVNAKAVLLNVVATHSRGTVFGVYTIMDDLGKGLGPALVSSFVRGMGRQDSFLLGMTFWLPCGLFCALTACTVPRDDLSDKPEEVSATAS